MLKYLAALCALFVLTFYISVKDEQAAHNSTHNAANTNNGSVGIIGGGVGTKDHSQENADDTKRYFPRWYSFFRWPEGTAFWALILTLWAVAEQADEVRRATNSQRSKDRARLDISIAETGQNYVLGEGNVLVSPFFWEFVVEIVQRGDTKAFNVIGKATLSIKPSAQSRPTIPEAKMLRFEGLPAIIEGNESRTIVASIATEAASEDVLREIGSGTLIAHFFGLIRYEDVFGVKHKSTFRYVWRPEVRDEVPGVLGETQQIEAAGWERAGRKKDNYAD